MSDDGAEDLAEALKDNTVLQARNLRRAAAGDASGDAALDSSGETRRGTVKSTGPKFGFISCEELEHGEDVFCHGPVLGMFGVGAEVDFEVVLNAKGHPQASNVRAAGATLNSGDNGAPHIGVVSAIGPKFGFLKCPIVSKKYGMDVFMVPQACLEPVAAGQKVRFLLSVTEQGQPQAQNVIAEGEHL